MNVGDKMICIKSDINHKYIVGQIYTITEFHHDDVIFTDIYSYWYFVKKVIFKENFVSLQEYRKLKLKKINERR